MTGASEAAGGSLVGVTDVASRPQQRLLHSSLSRWKDEEKKHNCRVRGDVEWAPSVRVPLLRPSKIPRLAPVRPALPNVPSRPVLAPPSSSPLFRFAFNSFVPSPEPSPAAAMAAAPPLSKAEYLKRYLSGADAGVDGGPESGRKRRKKRPKPSGAGGKG